MVPTDRPDLRVAAKSTDVVVATTRRALVATSDLDSLVLDEERAVRRRREKGGSMYGLSHFASRQRARTSAILVHASCLSVLFDPE